MKSALVINKSIDTVFFFKKCLFLFLCHTVAKYFNFLVAKSIDFTLCFTYNNYRVYEWHKTKAENLTVSRPGSVYLFIFFYLFFIFISIFILLTRRKATEALYIG